MRPFTGYASALQASGRRAKGIGRRWPLDHSEMYNHEDKVKSSRTGLEKTNAYPTIPKDGPTELKSGAKQGKQLLRETSGKTGRAG